MVYVSGGGWPLVTQREMWRESQEGLVYSLGVSGGFLQVDLNRIFRGVERSLGQTR